MISRTPLKGCTCLLAARFQSTTATQSTSPSYIPPVPRRKPYSPSSSKPGLGIAATLRDRPDEIPQSFGVNQHIPIDPELQHELDEIVTSFKAPIRFAFAYGSAVFKQRGYSSTDKPLLDFVFAVSHPSHWHDVNVHQYPDHYSGIAKTMGSTAMGWIQSSMGARVWFNVECKVNGRIIKYGVVSVDDLCRDLLDWETLYLSGRMHKPISVLRDNPRIRLANQVNLASALRTALLMLPEKFDEQLLYTTIAGLSYKGDFRMHVGENPAKVSNIVSGQMSQLQGLYRPLLHSFSKTLSLPAQTSPTSLTIQQDASLRSRADMAKRLPVTVKDKVIGFYERKWNLDKALGGSEGMNTTDEIALWSRLVEQSDFRQVLDNSLQSIVSKPAFTQSMKGIASVGVLKGIRYVYPKLQKRWAGPK